MGLYDENGNLNDNHWMFVSARWAGSALQTSTKDSTTFDFNYSGVLLWDITYN